MAVFFKINVLVVNILMKHVKNYVPRLQDFSIQFSGKNLKIKKKSLNSLRICHDDEICQLEMVGTLIDFYKSFPVLN